MPALLAGCLFEAPAVSVAEATTMAVAGWAPMKAGALPDVPPFALPLAGTVEFAGNMTISETGLRSGASGATLFEPPG